jgi:F-type H+-transporting ATPase subunit delta
VIEVLASRMNLATASRNFIFLLIDHRRTEMLREIQEAFQSELNARLGIAEAHVVSARDLSAEEKRELTSALERRTGKKIEARFHRDESLLGGAVVRVGSTVYDGSVREQLTRLRQQLEAEWEQEWRISKPTKSRRSCASRSKIISKLSQWRKWGQ